MKKVSKYYSEEESDVTVFCFMMLILHGSDGYSWRLVKL
jgi:hypothetical protein